jgi:hypothetical protein
MITRAFLDHFGLESARDLPGLKELREAGLLEARMDGDTPPGGHPRERTDPMNQLVNMIMRMVMRNLVNRGVNAGINQVTRARRPRQQPRETRPQARHDDHGARD